MKPALIALMALVALPNLAAAQELQVTQAIVPLSPPGVMAHAAFMQITNTGTKPRSLIGVRSADYAMAHIHQSQEQNGIATMSALDAVQIAPGQTVSFAHGGLHVMLMHPKTRQHEGDTVQFTLDFANGEQVPVLATVTRVQHHGS